MCTLVHSKRILQRSFTSRIFEYNRWLESLNLSLQPYSCDVENAKVTPPQVYSYLFRRICSLYIYICQKLFLVFHFNNTHHSNYLCHIEEILGNQLVYVLISEKFQIFLIFNFFFYVISLSIWIFYFFEKKFKIYKSWKNFYCKIKKKIVVRQKFVPNIIYKWVK